MDVLLGILFVIDFILGLFMGINIPFLVDKKFKVIMNKTEEEKKEEIKNLNNATEMKNNDSELSLNNLTEEIIYEWQNGVSRGDN